MTDVEKKYVLNRKPPTVKMFCNHSGNCHQLKTDVTFVVKGPGPAGLKSLFPKHRGKCSDGEVPLHLSTQIAVLPFETDRTVGAGLDNVLPYPSLETALLCIKEETAKKILYPDTNTIEKM
jgi:hypothetical protein